MKHRSGSLGHFTSNRSSSEQQQHLHRTDSAIIVPSLGNVSKLREHHMQKIEAESRASISISGGGGGGTPPLTPSSARTGPNQWVILNVGGTVFETTARTLSLFPQSPLCTMLQPQHKLAHKQHDDATASSLATVGIIPRQQITSSGPRTVYHIDRDPQLFSMILQYLRTGNVMSIASTSDTLGSVNLEALMIEAQHFKIDRLVSQLNIMTHGQYTRESSGENGDNVGDVTDEHNGENESATTGHPRSVEDSDQIAPPPDFSRRQLINTLASMSMDQHPRFRGVYFNTLDLSRLSMRNANAELSSFVRSVCVGTDFTMANLRGTHWMHSNIKGAILNEVDLEGSVLHHVDMTNCNLKNANLSKVRFSGGCKLDNATFHGCSFEDSTISDAHIRGAVFHDCNLSGVNFIDCNTISEAQFHNCQFAKTCFKHSVPHPEQTDPVPSEQKTVILRSLFRHCTFQHMDIDMVHLSYVDLSESSFDHVKLDLMSMKESHCNISDTTFVDCDWSRVDLSSFNTGNVKLTRCDVRGTSFRGSNLSGACFIACDMREAILHDCMMDENTSFIECDLRMAEYAPSHLAMHSVNLEKSNFTGEDWSSKSMDENGTLPVHNMRLSGANMSNMNLCGVDLSYGVLDNADLSNSTLVDAVFEYCKFKDAKFGFDELRKSKSIIGSDFTGVDWSNKNLSGMCLREVILRDANLQNCQFEKVDLTDAILDGADLRYANINADDLEAASTEGARLHGENIISSSFGDVSGDLFVNSISEDNSPINIIADTNYRFHKIQCMDFHGNMGLMGTEDGSILVTSLNPEKIVDKIDGHGSVDCLQFSRDIMCCNRREKIEIWNWEEKSRLGVLSGHSKMVQSLVFSDHTLISGSYDSTIMVWNLETQQLVSTLKCHQGSVKVLHLDDKDRRTLISGGKDSEMFIWDLRTSEARPMHRLQLDKGISSVNCMDRVENQLVWCGVGDTAVRVWDLRFIPSLSIVTGSSSSSSSSFVGCQSTPTSPSLFSSPVSPCMDIDSCLHGGYPLQSVTGTIKSSQPPPLIQKTVTDAPIPYGSVRYKAGVLLGLSNHENRQSLSRASIFSGSFGSNKPLLVEEQGLYHDVYVSSSKTMQGHTLPITSLATLGNSIATGGEDSIVNVWDLTSGQLLRSLHSHSGPVRCISIV